MGCFLSKRCELVLGESKITDSRHLGVKQCILEMDKDGRLRTDHEGDDSSAESETHSGCLTEPNLYRPRIPHPLLSEETEERQAN